VVIPARLGSSRFPRKVLARDTGKYLVEHVHERVRGCPGVDRVIIATDSAEVLDAARSFGAEAIMTSPAHASGTDRVAEVARGLDHDVVINVQGDEPLIEHDDLITLRGLFEEREGGPGARRTSMATLAVRRFDAEGFRDPNIVKVALAANGEALYFSRAPIPHAGPADAGGGRVEWLQHVGVYAYRREFLLRLAGLPPAPLEKRERLEQLRALENGFSIRVGLTSHPHAGIDTEGEYRRFVEEYQRALRRDLM
jgi:3-deoxy-manno-octulosonate cytidylyltransferase (CMP-KDO synthetase)